MNATEQENRPHRAGDGSREQFISPPANVAADKDGYHIELEMPGVGKEGLEISVESGELIVTGRRKREFPEGQLLYYETAPADFRRAFELGADVDTTKIMARIEQGILKLTLPKREDFKPKKIPVGD